MLGSGGGDFVVVQEEAVMREMVYIKEGVRPGQTFGEEPLLHAGGRGEAHVVPLLLLLSAGAVQRHHLEAEALLLHVRPALLPKIAGVMGVEKRFPVKILHGINEADRILGMIGQHGMHPVVPYLYRLKFGKLVHGGHSGQRRAAPGLNGAVVGLPDRGGAVDPQRPGRAVLVSYIPVHPAGEIFNVKVILVAVGNEDVPDRIQVQSIMEHVKIGIRREIQRELRSLSAMWVINPKR